MVRTVAAAEKVLDFAAVEAELDAGRAVGKGIPGAAEEGALEEVVVLDYDVEEEDAGTVKAEDHGADIEEQVQAVSATVVKTADHTQAYTALGHLKAVSEDKVVMLDSVVNSCPDPCLSPVAQP